jgi:uncharacterized protein (TIGR02588 family)
MAAKRASRSTRAKQDETSAPEAGKRRGRDSGTSPWEWAAAAVGAAILLSIVGYLVYAGVSRPERAEPAIAVSGKPPVTLADGTHLVPFTVENRGHTTGAGVTVSGALLDAAGAIVEESAVTFDFIAPRSREHGGLYFTADPRGLRLQLRAEGYTEP